VTFDKYVCLTGYTNEHECERIYTEHLAEHPVDPDDIVGFTEVRREESIVIDSLGFAWYYDKTRRTIGMVLADYEEGNGYYARDFSDALEALADGGYIPFGTED